MIVEPPWARTQLNAFVLEQQRRSAAASALRRFLSTPEARHPMRAPTAGVPPSGSAPRLRHDLD